MLQGKTVRGAHTADPMIDAASLVGRVVTDVEAYGKNLLIRFDDERSLHTHMKMSGSWYIHRPTDPWRERSARARVVLEVDDAVAVCLRAPVVALLGPREVPSQIETLGPDLLSPSFVPTEGIAGLRAHDDVPLGDAILRQGAVAGAGNIYKSETLFACGADPFAPVAAFTDEELRAILAHARRYLRSNLSKLRPRYRIAGESDRIWVYRRSGLPCFRCGTTILRKRQSALARSTYFCPTCQPARAR
jgi:endonuclease-8